MIRGECRAMRAHFFFYDSISSLLRLNIIRYDAPFHFGVVFLADVIIMPSVQCKRVSHACSRIGLTIAATTIRSHTAAAREQQQRQQQQIKTTIATTAAAAAAAVTTIETAAEAAAALLAAAQSTAKTGIRGTEETYFEIQKLNKN